MKNQSVFGYVRVSTKEQAVQGISLEAQESKIKTYCELHDLDGPTILRDEGVSACKRALRSRAGARELVEKIRSRQAKAVVMYRLDRLCRRTKDALFLAELCNQKKVELHSISENIDTSSPMGEFFFTVMAAIAQLEGQVISQRTKDALAQKKKNRQLYCRTDKLPYGWRLPADYHNEVDKFKARGLKRKEIRALVPATLLPEPKEQRIIEQMKKLRAEGLSCQRVGCSLDLMGLKPRSGGKWDTSTIYRILKREGINLSPKNADG